MNDTSTAAAPAETETKAAAKVEPTGDFIVDTANKIKDLSKTKAINRVVSLLAAEGDSDFEIGGLLLSINNNSWFDGHESFDEMVEKKFGMHPRKGRYLMTIFKELTDKQIPWDTVKGLGWTRLRELAQKGVLTIENVDEWVAKAANLSVVELIKVLKAPEGDGLPSTKTNDGIQTLKFKLKPDQVESWNAASAKIKAEANTEYDTVAFELMTQSILSGGATVQKTLEQLIAETKPMTVLHAFNKVYPDWTLGIDPPAGAEVEEAPAEDAAVE